MPKETEIICIMCPLGCRITATTDDEGNVVGVANHLCKEGKQYATAECRFPGRILTATVLTEGSSRKLLPVRTREPLPKESLREAMRSLSQVRAKPPIEIGQVIVADILNTGVDLIATDKLLF